MGEEFVGAGWAFPLRTDPTGRSPWSTGTARSRRASG